MSLLEELKQKKPFRSVTEEALLSIVRTSAVLMDRVELLLRPYGITATQYNVLRILRGSEPDGLHRNDLRDRMLTRMPDVTRLLDRMEQAGLVQRTRGEADRRLVRTRPTQRALDLLQTLDDLVPADQKRWLSAVSEEELKSLVDILARIRDAKA